MNMDEEIKEIFVSRQDTFKEKVANAYIKKTEECKELREEIERMQQNEEKYHLLKEKCSRLLMENSQMKEEIASIRKKTLTEKIMLKSSLEDQKVVAQQYEDNHQLVSMTNGQLIQKLNQKDEKLQLHIQKTD